MTSFPEPNLNLNPISKEHPPTLTVPLIQNINKPLNNINSFNNTNTFNLSKDDETFPQQESNLLLNKTDRGYYNLNKTTPNNFFPDKKPFPFFPPTQPSYRSSTPIIEAHHDKPSSNQLNHKFNYHISCTEPNCSNVNVDNNITNDIFITDPNDIKMMNDWTPLHTEPSLMYDKYKKGSFKYSNNNNKHTEESGVVQRTGNILDNIDRVIHSRRINNIPEEKDIVYPPVYCSRKDNYVYNSLYGNKVNMDDKVFSTFGVNTISTEDNNNNKEMDVNDKNVVMNVKDDKYNSNNSGLNRYSDYKVNKGNGVYYNNMRLFFDYSNTNEMNEINKIKYCNNDRINVDKQMNEGKKGEKCSKCKLVDNYWNKIRGDECNDYDDEFYVIPKDKRIKMTPEMIIKDEIKKQQHIKEVRNLYNETFKKVSYVSQKYMKYSKNKNN